MDTLLFFYIWISLLSSPNIVFFLFLPIYIYPAHNSHFIIVIAFTYKVSIFSCLLCCIPYVYTVPTNLRLISLIYWVQFHLHIVLILFAHRLTAYASYILDLVCLYNYTVSSDTFSLPLTIPWPLFSELLTSVSSNSGFSWSAGHYYKVHKSSGS